MFSVLPKTEIIKFATFKLLSANALNLVQSKRMSSKDLRPGFYVSEAQVFRKRAISPFPTVFSTRSDELSAIFIKFYIVVFKLFQFVRA